MDGGAWQATVHRVAESDTIERLTHTCTLLTVLSVQFSSDKYILVIVHSVSRMLHLWKMKLYAH